MQVNERVTYSYTGNVQTVTLIPGEYKLECYGAAGQSKSSSYDGVTYKHNGGKGGYSCGTIILKEETKLYIYVGGTSNGYNGGGRGGGSSYPGGYGGGATDIRINGTTLNDRIIVAGGGGGCTYSNTQTYYTGGAGGGTKGGDGGSIGGTQTSGYALGKGGYGANVSGAGTGGGGGGYYGGYGGKTYGDAGGGGSGYISPILVNARTSTSSHNNNGVCYITALKFYGSLKGHCKIDNTWREIDNFYVKIDDTWKEIDSVYMKIDNTWRKSE